MTLGNREGVRRFECCPGTKRNTIHITHESKTCIQISDRFISSEESEREQKSKKRSKHVVNIFRIKET